MLFMKLWVFIAILFVVGCSKQGDKPRNFEVSLASLASSDFTGGVLFRMKNNQTGEVSVKELLTSPFVVAIPDGNFTFHMVGFTGASSFSGTPVCGSLSNTTLTAETTDIYITMNQSCAAEPFASIIAAKGPAERPREIALFTAANLSASLPGGILLKITDTNTNASTSFNLTSPFNVSIPDGSYTVDVVGYTGASPYSGTPLCGSVSGLSLLASTARINVTLNQSCSNAVYTTMIASSPGMITRTFTTPLGTLASGILVITDLSTNVSTTTEFASVPATYTLANGTYKVELIAFTGGAFTGSVFCGSVASTSLISSSTSISIATSATCSNQPFSSMASYKSSRWDIARWDDPYALWAP